MKTYAPRLAPMAVVSLLGGVRTVRYNEQRDDWCCKQGCGAPKKNINQRIASIPNNL